MDRIKLFVALLILHDLFGGGGGMVVTASHNPKEYNGMKVFYFSHSTISSFLFNGSFLICISRLVATDREVACSE